MSSRRASGRSWSGAGRSAHLVLKVAHHGSLGQAGARIYRTDRDGAVLLDTDGAALRVTRWARRDTETLRLASTP